jgi:hypothetical protein
MKILVVYLSEYRDANQPGRFPAFHRASGFGNKEKVSASFLPPDRSGLT